MDGRSGLSDTGDEAPQADGTSFRAGVRVQTRRAPRRPWKFTRRRKLRLAFSLPLVAVIAVTIQLALRLVPGPSSLAPRGRSWALLLAVFGMFSDYVQIASELWLWVTRALVLAIVAVFWFTRHADRATQDGRPPQDQVR